MAFDLRPASELAREGGIKILVHGPPGVGKTTLCTTTGHLAQTAIISAEGGLKSVRRLGPCRYCGRSYHAPDPTCEIFDTQHHAGKIETWREFEEAYQFFAGDAGALGYFKTICLDSITEIAEVCLNHEKSKAKDPRKAYGETYDKVKDYVRRFRKLPYNIVFLAQQKRFTPEGAPTRIVPAIPGKALLEESWLARQFDEIFAFRMIQNPTAGAPDLRLLQTQPDALYEAKDRSTSLEFWQTPDLADIYQKILGTSVPSQQAQEG